MDWKERAIHLYYEEHKKIIQIAKECNKHRVTITNVLKEHDEKAFYKEKGRRKLETKERTKEQKREWWRNNRGVNTIQEKEEYWYD